MAVKLPPCPPLTAEGFASSAWQRWLDLLRQALVATYSPDNPQLSTDTPGAPAAAVAALAKQLDALRTQLATAPDASAGLAQLRKNVVTTGSNASLASLVTIGDVTAGGRLGVNGATAQSAAPTLAALTAYAAGANGLATGAAMAALVAKVQAIDAALKANGICS